MLSSKMTHQHWKTLQLFSSKQAIQDALQGH